MPIRTVALCIIQRNDELLLEETYYPDLDKIYYRPIGGTVEIGENSKQTIVREVKEEIDADIKDPELIYVIENIFSYKDQIGHEIDFIYRSELIDKSLYEEKEINGIEGQIKYKAIWKSIEAFMNNDKIKLVPDGLLELLQGQDKKRTSDIRHIRTT
jgi:ADP-ribose pyrophosphatase YjhB (NUDIX family)